MKIARKIFMNYLSELYPAKGSGEENTSSNSFSFFSDDLKNNYIGVTDNVIAVIKQIPEYIPDCKVPGEKLFQLIRKSTKVKELDIQVSENSFDIVYDNNPDNISNISFGKQSANMLDRLDKPSDSLYRELPENFTEAILFCAPYVSQDRPQTLLNFVYAEGQKVCSGSSGEFVCAKLVGEVEKQFIPANYCKILSQYKPTHFCYFNDLLYYKNSENTIIVLQSVYSKERYPFVVTLKDFTQEELNSVKKQNLMLKNMFRMENPCEISFQNKEGSNNEIVDLISSCKIFSSSIDKPEKIKVNILNDKLVIEAVGASGKHKASCEVQGNGVSLEFICNPQLLLDIVNRKHTVKTDGEKMIIMDKNFAHLIWLK